MRHVKYLFSTLILLLCSVTAGAYNFEVDGIYYNITSKEDLTVEVTSRNNDGTSYSGEVVIPSNVIYGEMEYSVTSIGGRAFSSCSDLTSIIIPESVTSIESSAFIFCSSLTSITIPESVTSIESSAFRFCSSLTSITIPEGVTSIGEGAFEGCTGELIVNCNIPSSVFYGSNFTKVTIGNSVTTIGSYAFQDCCNLTSITIPESVTSIGEAAFYRSTGELIVNCNIPSRAFVQSKFTKVTIGDSVTTIGAGAFQYCDNLTSITIAENSKLTSIGGGAWGGGAFSDCSSLTSITIPESVTSIGGWAFSRCSSLASITIPESVTSIGRNAFYETAWYNNQPDGVLYVGKVLYKYKGVMYDNTSIEVKEGTTEIAVDAFSGCNGLASITLPEGVTSIGESAFYECSNLTSITLPEGVTSIGGSAFSGCKGLTSVTLPKSLTSIGNWAFRYCGNGHPISITIPEGVTSIGGGAFEGSRLGSIIVAEGNTVYDSRNGCNALIETSSNTLIKGSETSIIPEGVTSIGEAAFESCGIRSITLPESVTSIGNKAFNSCRSLASINIPEGVTSIGEFAFNECDITSINIPKGVTSIEKAAFRSCGLTSINIPEGVKSIGESAFWQCGHLTSITLPEGVISIGNEAFAICGQLTSITIPEGVTSIGESAFTNCGRLTSIVLPRSLKTVGTQAFANCPSLSNVYCYAESVPSAEPEAFVGSNITNTILRVPADALDSYKATGPWSRFGSILAFGEYITDVELSQSSATLVEGEALSLGITLTPEDTDVILIAWSSSNSSVATVDKQGKVTAVAPGKATITAAAIDGGEASDSCEVTVLYADYVITYEVDGEVYATDTITRASAVTPLAEPIKEGYTFSGWSEIPETMPGHDVTVSGTFTINKYLVNFALDGVVISSSSLEYGTAIVAPEVAEREGYTFGGWQNLLETVPANDTTIIGNFLINSYTVTYVVEEEVYHTDTLAFGSQITAIKYPVKEGYTFSGWSETPEFMPAKDLTITGTFIINSYRITYTVDGVEHHTDSIEYGDTIAVIAAPVKEGYSFSGWSEIPETMPANDVSVNGKFTINGYTVTYVVEGEVFHTDTITFGSQITSIKNPVKEGHTFAGWGDVPEFMPAKDLTITGTFSINSYRITYTVDGVEHHTDSIEYGDTIAVIAAPVKEGYSFSGWSEIPETMPANDVSVSGKFTINRYQITYIVGEDVYHTDSIAYGTYITSIKNPVKEGYTFIEWIDIPEQMPASDVTTIGSFSINKYKVTYTADNVTIYTDSIVYGGQIKDIASPTKEGYSFGGWEKSHQTMPAYDVVINGTFIINKYQISYVVGGETIHTDSITYNERITPIESPEQEGFTFSGWIGVPGIMPAYDVTVGGEFFIKNMQTDSQGLMYVLNEETETFELSNYEGNLTGTIVIPADLYGYPVNGIKERALMGAENLIAVVIPENVSSVGYRAFYGCNNLSYIEWETTAPVDAACFDEPARHGNLLVYVKDAATEVTYQGNVIVDGVAERIAITNEQPLRNIREFTARNITFTRQFTKKTERGVAGGWEAMIIPFDVETVTSENRGELKPFGEADFTTSLPYWIAQLQTDGSFAYIDSIKANRPFIMEVPNCDEYQDIYNVEGAISFGAENVTVYVTTDMNHDMGNGYTMMGNYEGTASDGYVYALNDEEYAADGDVYLPGGVFVADSRDIRPFEAYIYSNQPTAAPYLRIGKKGTTDIDNLLIQRTDDAWYNLQGVRLSGKPTERGVYIINRKKVVID